MNFRPLLFTLCIILMFQWNVGTTNASNQEENRLCWSAISSLLLQIKERLMSADTFSRSWPRENSTNFMRQIPAYIFVADTITSNTIEIIESTTREQQGKSNVMCSETSSLRKYFDALTNTNFMKNYVDIAHTINHKTSKPPSDEDVIEFMSKCDTLQYKIRNLRVVVAMAMMRA